MTDDGAGAAWESRTPVVRVRTGWPAVSRKRRHGAERRSRTAWARYKLAALPEGYARRWSPRSELHRLPPAYGAGALLDELQGHGAT